MNVRNARRWAPQPVTMHDQAESSAEAAESGPFDERPANASDRAEACAAVLNGAPEGAS